MDAVVWVDGWQMRCCGEPFSIGSRVRWNLVEPDREWFTTVLGDADAAAVGYAAQSHGDRTDIVGEGIVKAIREVMLHVTHPSMAWSQKPKSSIAD